MSDLGEERAAHSLWAVEPQEVSAVRIKLELFRKSFFGNSRVDFHEEGNPCLKEFVRLAIVEAAVARRVGVPVIIRRCISEGSNRKEKRKKEY
jgi:hypothetical protein